jgi:hypothetical protein
MTEARGVATFGVALGLMTLAARSRAAEGPGDTQTLPCRPTIACTADFVPPGAFELEAGYQYRRLAGNQRQSSFPFLAKLTLDRWVQAQVGSNGYTAVQGADCAPLFRQRQPRREASLLRPGTSHALRLVLGRGERPDRGGSRLRPRHRSPGDRVRHEGCGPDPRGLQRRLEPVRRRFRRALPAVGRPRALGELAGAIRRDGRELLLHGRRPARVSRRRRLVRGEPRSEAVADVRSRRRCGVLPWHPARSAHSSECPSCRSWCGTSSERSHDSLSPLHLSRNLLRDVFADEALHQVQPEVQPARDPSRPSPPARRPRPARAPATAPYASSSPSAARGASSPALPAQPSQPRRAGAPRCTRTR